MDSIFDMDPMSVAWNMADLEWLSASDLMVDAWANGELA